jgi:hypothetical protein
MIYADREDNSFFGHQSQTLLVDTPSCTQCSYQTKCLEIWKIIGVLLVPESQDQDNDGIYCWLYLLGPLSQ